MQMAKNEEKKKLNKDMGSRIRLARENAGLTQEKFAEKIDVSTQYISDLERGMVGASTLTLYKLCLELSVSSDYILMGLETNRIPALDISVRLNALSESERRIVDNGISAILDAFDLYKKL